MCAPLGEVREHGKPVGALRMLSYEGLEVAAQARNVKGDSVRVRKAQERLIIEREVPWRAPRIGQIIRRLRKPQVRKAGALHGQRHDAVVAVNDRYRGR